MRTVKGIPFYLVVLSCAVFLFTGCEEAAKPPAEKAEAPVKEAAEPAPAETAEPESAPLEAPAPEPAPTVVTPPTPPAPSAEEHTVKLKCVADTHLATSGGETTNARGGSSGVKIKHREDFPLLKFDTSAIPANATVRKAGLFLHLKNADPSYFLSHVSVSTVPTDWIEGDGAASGEHDVACLLWPGPRAKKWGWQDDIDVLGSIFGNAGNVTCLGIAKDKGDQWWELALDPRVVDAIRRDQPGGIILHDEMIHRVGGPANIYFDSKEQSGGAFAPYIEVTYAVEDTAAPSVPQIVSQEPGPYPGAVLLRIKCGGDDGNSGTALGFSMQVIEGGPMTAVAPTEVQRYMIPRPKVAGTIVPALIEGLQPGREHTFWVTAYDEAGNKSSSAMSKTVMARESEPKPLAAFKPVSLPKGGPLVVGPVSVYAVDGLTKVEPVNGNVIGGPLDSRNGNHVYNGRDKRIEVFGARGEIVGVNLVIEAQNGAALPVSVSVKPATPTGADVVPAEAFRLYRVIYAKDRFAEVTVPDAGPYTIPSADPKINGQKSQMVALDLYIPQDAPAGDYRGELEISAGGATAKLPVAVKVYSALLPDDVTFYVELNAYGCGNKDYFYAVHRLAHLHRLGYNALSYSHSGNTSLPVVPKVEGEGAAARVVDWTPWDSWMSPLLDGSLFDDMPRKGVPIPHFYLPQYENWPMPLQAHFTNKELAQRARRPRTEADSPAYDAWKMKFAKEAPLMEDALDEAWIEGNQAISREFRRHFEENGWTRTEFQFFLNNKYYKGDLTYWTLDEPSAGHDFRALAYIYRIQAEPFIGSKLKVASRGDVSRPEHQGDRMDDVPFNLLNMSGGYHRYTPLCRRFIVMRGFRTWLYGGGGGVEGDNTGLDAVIVKSWLMGADGCMPYWTSFSDSNEWTGGGNLRQVYNGKQHGYDEEVVGCLRMFAMRRGQEDCELLNLLAKKPGWDRWQVGRTVLSYLKLGGELKARGADDPGRVSFSGITPADLAALRRAILEELSK